MKINVKEARSKLSLLLDRVEEGEEIIITRHGKEIARLVKPSDKNKKLPTLKKSRSSIKIKGEPMSTIVIQERKSDLFYLKGRLYNFTIELTCRNSGSL